MNVAWLLMGIIYHNDAEYIYIGKRGLGYFFLPLYIKVGRKQDFSEQIIRKSFTVINVFFYNFSLHHKKAVAIAV